MAKLFSKNYYKIFILRFHSVFLVVESLIFGLFVTAILCEQITSIVNIDKTRQSSLYYSLKMIFQTSNPLLWFLPCDLNLLNKKQFNDLADTTRNHHQTQQHNHYTV